MKKESKSLFFKGKTIVISGGSTGIGLSLAQETLNLCSSFQKLENSSSVALTSVFPKCIVLIARDLNKLSEAQKKLESQIEDFENKFKFRIGKIDCKVEIISCDVSNKEKVDEMFSEDNNNHGKILKSAEIWFLNQGMAIPKYFLEQSIRFKSFVLIPKKKPIFLQFFDQKVSLKSK